MSRPLFLCLGLFIFSFSQPVQAQIKPIRPFNGIKALIVGVSDYQQPGIPDLQYAHRDAAALADYLREESPWPVAAEDLVLLTNETATYANFMAELTAIAERCQPNDRLLLYFSGHGSIEAEADEPMGYLLFHDAPPNSYASGGACKITTLNQIFEKIVREKKADIVLISDACRSGSLAGEPFRGAETTTAALAELFSGVIKMLSCEASQLSYESPHIGGGRGIFSYYLVEGMRGQADFNENRFVDLFELERYVQDEVRKATKDKQHPIRQGGVSDFKVSRVARGARRPPASVASPDPDSSAIPDMEQFEAALARGQLLYPQRGSAYEVYQQMKEGGIAPAYRKAMEMRLMSALQNEAQQAINDYITSPGREIAKRWADQSVYAHYPEYLEVAASLAGKENLFYADIQSRAYYFRGVNLRLQADGMKNPPDSMLQQAITLQKQALELNFLAPHVHNELGLLYRDLEKTDQEIFHFQRAIALAPTWGLVLTNLGATYQRQSQYELAKEMYRNALARDSSLALAHYNLAVLYQETGEAEAATASYRKTIQMDASFADAYYNLASIYADDEARFPQALELLGRYQKMEPDVPYGYDLEAYLHIQMGNQEAALNSTLAALETDSTSFYALQNAVLIYDAQSEYEKALPLLSRMIRHYPEQKVGYRDKAYCLLQLGRKQEAVATIRQLLDNGYRDYDALQKDAALSALQSEPAYQALMQQYFPEQD